MNVKKLEKIVVGFINNSLKKSAEEFLKTEIVKKCQSHVLSTEEAKSFFKPDAKNEGMTSQLRKLMQKHIGGGMSEFLRDVKNMKDNEFMVVIDVEDCTSDEVETIKNRVKNFGFHKAKHLGLFGVEHLTIEDGHDEEMRFLKSLGF